VKRKDLAEWEREYGGTTAEGIAKRVINKYSPSIEELSQPVYKELDVPNSPQRMEIKTNDQFDICVSVLKEVVSAKNGVAFSSLIYSENILRFSCDFLLNDIHCFFYHPVLSDCFGAGSKRSRDTDDTETTPNSQIVHQKIRKIASGMFQTKKYTISIMFCSIQEIAELSVLTT
jgi:hypothetical protein